MVVCTKDNDLFSRDNIFVITSIYALEHFFIESVRNTPPESFIHTHPLVDLCVYHDVPDIPPIHNMRYM